MRNNTSLCRPMSKNLHNQSGLSVIEILITLVVLSSGLLSMGFMMGTSIKGASESYQRSQAVWLAYEMLDRMRANPDYLGAYVPNIITSSTSLTNPGSITTGADRASRDLYEWQQKLTTSAHTSLNDATGRLSVDGVVYQVVVEWQGGSRKIGTTTRKVTIQTEIQTD